MKTLKWAITGGYPCSVTDASMQHPVHLKNENLTKMKKIRGYRYSLLPVSVLHDGWMALLVHGAKEP